MEARITANAYGITQNYEMIQTVQSAEAESEALIRQLNGSIFSGIIDTNTGDVGIAIGQNAERE